MRIFKLLAFTALTACAAAPEADVSKSFATEAASGFEGGAMPGFGSFAVTAPQRSNAEMISDFLNLEFRMESGRALPVLTRFEGPITIGMSGDVPAGTAEDLSRLIARFRSEAGLPVSFASAGTAPSIMLNFESRSALSALVPTAACFVVPGVSSLAEYRAARGSDRADWAALTRRSTASVFIPADTSPQEVRDCLHEELAQAMGPLNDLYSLPDSVFNDDNFHTVLTGFDMLMLRVHYAPELRSGMNEAEVARHLPAIFARLNPAGEGRAGQGASLSPRTWVEAVEQTFGPGGGQAGHLAGAERMVSIAMAQGWRDARAGFAYFALGRVQAIHDPLAAVQALTKAAQIYRALPDTGVQLAHVDMQLAAIALMTGDFAQAIAFADRAAPAVRGEQNAAVLASLMLIKAEALEALGQAEAAQALRLDSRALAGYGFGPAAQQRAREADIASLAARGKRS